MSSNKSIDKGDVSIFVSTLTVHILGLVARLQGKRTIRQLCAFTNGRNGLLFVKQLNVLSMQKGHLSERMLDKDDLEGFFSIVMIFFVANWVDLREGFFFIICIYTYIYAFIRDTLSSFLLASLEIPFQLLLQFFTIKIHTSPVLIAILYTVMQFGFYLRVFYKTLSEQKFFENFNRFFISQIVYNLQGRIYVLHSEFVPRKMLSVDFSSFLFPLNKQCITSVLLRKYCNVLILNNHLVTQS
eukprot:TRINITY_DN16461_c0_g1_i1.p1 TRINITY_DN16461_c0_g1~~TRINITY_DN16461_c0_g1_i1.p1  ORF type:complete len:242 (-),score=0.77 TRINITY_DN16461_c0_g1_i1:334-1059(-)